MGPKLDGFEYTKEGCCPNCELEPEEFCGDYYEVDGEQFPKFLNEYAGYDSFGDFHNWDEYHVCRDCGTKFGFENGRY